MIFGNTDYIRDSPPTFAVLKKLMKVIVYTWQNLISLLPILIILTSCRISKKVRNEALMLLKKYLEEDLMKQLLMIRKFCVFIRYYPMDWNHLRTDREKYNTKYSRQMKAGTGRYCDRYIAIS